MAAKYLDVSENVFWLGFWFLVFLIAVSVVSGITYVISSRDKLQAAETCWKVAAANPNVRCDTFQQQ